MCTARVVISLVMLRRRKNGVILPSCLCQLPQEKNASLAKTGRGRRKRRRYATLFARTMVTDIQQLTERKASHFCHSHLPTSLTWGPLSAHLSENDDAKDVFVVSSVTMPGNFPQSAHLQPRVHMGHVLEISAQMRVCEASPLSGLLPTGGPGLRFSWDPLSRRGIKASRGTFNALLLPTLTAWKCARFSREMTRRVRLSVRRDPIFPLS